MAAGTVGSLIMEGDDHSHDHSHDQSGSNVADGGAPAADRASASDLPSPRRPAPARLTIYQQLVLERAFAKNPQPRSAALAKIAGQAGVSVAAAMRWFRNRRHRRRNKTETEVSANAAATVMALAESADHQAEVGVGVPVRPALLLPRPVPLRAAGVSAGPGPGAGMTLVPVVHSDAHGTVTVFHRPIATSLPRPQLPPVPPPPPLQAGPTMFVGSTSSGGGGAMGQQGGLVLPGHGGWHNAAAAPPSAGWSSPPKPESAAGTMPRADPHADRAWAALRAHFGHDTQGGTGTDDVDDAMLDGLLTMLRARPAYGMALVRALTGTVDAHTTALGLVSPLPPPPAAATAMAAAPVAPAAATVQSSSTAAPPSWGRAARTFMLPSHGMTVLTRGNSSSGGDPVAPIMPPPVVGGQSLWPPPGPAGTASHTRPDPATPGSFADAL
jgi:hypothetical protein